jgi:hypothetical protein
VSLYQPLFGVFPKKTENQRLSFNRLQEAYVDARYKDHFPVERHHLTEVARSVARLQQIVFDACGERVQSCEVDPDKLP